MGEEERGLWGGEWLLSDGQMSEPKSLLVDTRLSAGHYFDVLAVMSWLAVILCNVLVRIINILPALISQEIGRNFRSEKSDRTRPDQTRLDNTHNKERHSITLPPVKVRRIYLSIWSFIDISQCLNFSSLDFLVTYLDMVPPTTAFLLNVTVGCLKLCHIFHLM